jgi:outer membrane protein assembly factor BamB
LIWDYKKIHRTISTVSIDPATGSLFIADFSGFVFCLDAETGKEYWARHTGAHLGLNARRGRQGLHRDEDAIVLLLTCSQKVPAM